jgi:predicted metal-dependent hydrolase
MSINEILGTVHAKNINLYPMFWNRSHAQEFPLTFKDQEVSVLRKADKRSIGLTLQLDGRIGVSAPKSTPLSTIRSFLQANSEWIESHLSRYKALRDAYPRKNYVDGESFVFMGCELELRLGAGRVMRTETELFAPREATREAILAYYKAEGIRHLRARLEHFIEVMALTPSSTRFASQKTRWGSCSASGRVSLNWRLIFAPPLVIDYVIIHELAHLKHYNHSEQFWALVERHSVRAQEWREWLCQHQYDADFLAKNSELHPSL